VLPRAVLRGGQYAKFGTGSYDSARIAWDETWDLDQVEPLFPVPACVLIGRRRATASAIPTRMTVYSGHLPIRDAPENLADEKLKKVQGDAPPTLQINSHGRRSAFESMFRQGATLVPRMLCLVERKSAGRLGASAAMPLVGSRRNAQEKLPWRDLPGIEHPVEVRFLRSVYLGESILPFRIWRAFEGVIPVTQSGDLITAKGATDLGFSGLAGWMRSAEERWDTSGRGVMSLNDRWNYHNELGAQFPAPPLRIVFSKAGTRPAACLMRDPNGVIDHMLYWAQPESEQEGYYLLSILNSETARKRIESQQVRGLFGARHFDKLILTLPIPRFSATVTLHRDLAETGREAERLAVQFEIKESVPFARARRTVRDGLGAAGVSDRIDVLVARLLDG